MTDFYDNCHNYRNTNAYLDDWTPYAAAHISTECVHSHQTFHAIKHVEIKGSLLWKSRNCSKTIPKPRKTSPIATLAQMTDFRFDADIRQR